MLHLVIGSAARLIVGGAVIGLLLSVLLGRLLNSVLFNIQPLDPITFAAVTTVVILTAAAAIVGPAWRATRIDPAVALRNE